MTNPKNIYIIDDDIDDQQFLIEAFKEIDSSIECFTSKNGHEGLLKLKNALIPLPCLILLDINMPRVNGQRFLSELKLDPCFHSIPVIIYTTSSSPKDIEEMKRLGAFDYLIKQDDFYVLKEQLNGILSANLLV